MDLHARGLWRNNVSFDWARDMREVYVCMARSRSTI